jgi:hypothetical protein
MHKWTETKILLENILARFQGTLYIDTKICTGNNLNIKKKCKNLLDKECQSSKLNNKLNKILPRTSKINLT